MENDNKDQSAALPREAWSAITANDLGLKAVYWSGNAEDEMTFRPIVGWVTFNTLGPANPPLVPNGFAAIVVNDAWLPGLASNVRNFAGIAPIGATVEDVKRTFEEWRAEGDARRARMNASTVGQA